MNRQLTKGYEKKQVDALFFFCMCWRQTVTVLSFESF